MSSANPDASVGVGGAPVPPAVVFNPAASFAEFNFTSTRGFHYTEASFQRQVIARQNKTERGYQQKEAFPRPDGVSHDDWKKAFNSADSSVYNSNTQSSIASLNSRQNTHNTRVIAEEKLQARLLGNGLTVPGPEPAQGPVPVPVPAGILPSGNHSNNRHHQPTQQPSSSSARRSRKLNYRKKKVTFDDDQSTSFDSRKFGQPRRFQPSRASSRAIDYSNETDEDEDDQPLPPPEVKQATVFVTPSYNPGERNQDFRSDPNNHGLVLNNLNNGHRLNRPERSSFHAAVASNTFGTGLGSNPRNFPEPPLFTDNPDIGAEQTPSGENNLTQGIQLSGFEVIENHPNPSTPFFDHPIDLTERVFGQHPNIGEQQTRSGGNNSFVVSQTSDLDDAEHGPVGFDYRDYLPDHVFPQSLTTNTSNLGGFQQQSSFAVNGAIFGPPAPQRRSRLGDYSLVVPGPPTPQDDWNVGAQQPQFSAYGQNLGAQQQPSPSRFWEDYDPFIPPAPQVADNSNLVAQQLISSHLGEISSNLPGPQPSTDNSKSEKGMPSSSGIDPKITHKPPPDMDNSKTCAQIPSSQIGSNKPICGQRPSSSGFQAPRGSVFYTGSYPTSSNKNHVHPSPNNSHVPSPENNSGKSHVQPSSKNSSKSAHKPTPSKDNSKVAPQKPSSSESNSKNAQGQSSSKGSIKLVAKQSSSSLGSKTAAQPPPRKAAMSSQAKKPKGKVVYCVCKQNKHGTKMIACEGGCENWFHVSCVKILCDNTDGVATFICDTCPGKTTYKRLCRLEGCNRPHSTSESVGEDGKLRVVPSKYCSMEHRDEFLTRHVNRMEPRFTAELRSYFAQTSLGDFLTAGDQPTRAVLGAQHGGTDPPDGFAAIGPPHNDVGMNSLDFRERDGCRKNIARISETMLHYQNRAKLVAMLGKYSDETTKKYAEENKIVESAPKRAKDSKSGKSATHTICGYDPRIVVTDKWIDQYMATPEGDAAWKSGVIGEHTKPDIHVDVDPEYYKGICVRTKCQRHGEWFALRKEECEKNLEWEADKLTVENKKLDAQIERVQLRLAIEREREQYAQKRAAEMTPENRAGFLREWTTQLGDKNIILRQLLAKYQTSSTTV